MFEWIAANASTLVVCALIAAAVILVIINAVRNRKNGKSSCSCGCSSCPMSGQCHKENKK